MYEYARVESKAKGLITNFSQHQELIQLYASKGFRFAGYMPVEFFANGVLLEMDLIFEKNNDDIKYEYKYVTIEAKVKLLSNKIEVFREKINENAINGYRYVGFVPVDTSDNGMILSMNLIFEKTI